MKISEATNQQKIQALAELDGVFKRMEQQLGPLWRTCYDEHWRAIDNSGTGHGDFYSALPNYFASYDAIIPLIQRQTSFVCEQMIKYLFGSTTIKFGREFRDLFRLTPQQLSDALLVAAEKFEAV